MDDPTSLAGLPTVVATAVGVFFACMAAVSKWAQSQKVETTQVTLLTEDRDRWQERAERAEKAIEEYRAKLNQIVNDQSEMKAQNTIMLDKLTRLSEENAELKNELRKLTGGQNVRSIAP